MSIKKGALKRKIPFNITLEDLGDLWEKQPICPYSGVSLIQCKGKNDKCYTASLDRIDSDKGYQVKNIQWVWKPLNKMKSNLSDEAFKQIIETIELNGVEKLSKQINEEKKL